MPSRARRFMAWVAGWSTSMRTNRATFTAVRLKWVRMS